MVTEIFLFFIVATLIKEALFEQFLIHTVLQVEYT